MKKLILISILALMATPVLANPTLPDGVDAYWAINEATGQADAKIIFENALPGNVFGMFDQANPANILPVFLATDGINNTAVVTIIGNVGGIQLQSLDTDHPAYVGFATFKANDFGFFITKPDGITTLYSDTLLNPGQIDHMIASILIPGSEYQLTWDVVGAAPDLIVNVESVHPIIPAPGAILLGGIGVALVGWLRGRRTL